MQDIWYRNLMNKKIFFLNTFHSYIIKYIYALQKSKQKQHFNNGTNIRWYLTTENKSDFLLLSI